VNIEPENITILEKMVAITATVSTGWYFLWVQIFKKMWNTYEKKRRSNADKLDIIYNELTGNGGSTLRDAIGRIESRQILDELSNKAMMNHLSIAYYRADTSGIVTEVSRTLGRYLERLPDEFLGRAWLSTVEEEEREDVLDAWNFSVENGVEFSRCINFVTPKGKKLHSKVISFPLCDNEKVVGYFGTVVPCGENCE